MDMIDNDDLVEKVISDPKCVPLFFQEIDPKLELDPVTVTQYLGVWAIAWQCVREIDTAMIRELRDKIAELSQ